MEEKDHFSEAQISAAGRALADHNAKVCGVNKDDNWNVFGDQFIGEARLALAAVAAVAAVYKVEDVKQVTPQAATDDVRDVLRPFADLAELFDDENRGANMPSSGPVMCWPRLHKEYELTVEHFRAARDALRTTSTDGEKGGAA